MRKLQARALQQVVHASTAAHAAAQPVEERPTCPACKARLEPLELMSARFELVDELLDTGYIGHGHDAALGQHRR